MQETIDDVMNRGLDFGEYEGILWQSRKPRLYMLATCIARVVQAKANCEANSNKQWLGKWIEKLRDYEYMLPSGAGIDCGTKIDCDRSTGDKLVLTFLYHHMNENGYYDGWNDYVCYVRPAFDGITLSIRGRNRNDILDYLYEVYETALTDLIEEN